MNIENLNQDTSEPKMVRRGFDKEDDRWFSKEAVSKLQIAQEELQWLLNRGYKMETVMNLIGSRYQFSVRQRNALQRGTSTIGISQMRKEKMLSYDDAKNGPIFIDGFNLIITLEVALSESTLILGTDGTIRDIAGLRGTYSIIDKTEKALKLIGKAFSELRVPKVIFYLDSPVSNSGRLKCKILQHAMEWETETEVELVKNADSILSHMERIVTSDSIILDSCKSWFNLSRKILDDYVVNLRVINLSGQKSYIDS